MAKKKKKEEKQQRKMDKGKDRSEENVDNMAEDREASQEVKTI